MTTLIPTAIIDKNGKSTTVHRRALGDKNARVLPSIPVKKEIKEVSFWNSGDLLQDEINAFESNSFGFAKRLSSATGWEMYSVLEEDDKPLTKDAYDIGSRYFAVKLPNGMFVDIWGIKSESKLLKTADGVEFHLERVEDELRDHLEGYEEEEPYHLDYDIVVSKAHKVITGSELFDWRRTVDDTDSVIVDGEEIPIALDTHSPIACPKCETFFPEGIEGSVWTNAYHCVCQNCGEVTHIEDVICAVRESSAAFSRPDAVKEASWFHFSTKERWHEGVLNSPDNPVVHLGTEEAALDRGRHIGRSTKPMYIYEVRLNSDVVISNPMFLDEDSDQPRTIEEMGKKRDMTADGVNRYLNRYENAGSVSLMANPRAFEVVGVRTV